MTGIRVVENTLPGLVRDLSAIPPDLAKGLPRVVARNAKAGNTLARRIAREKAGKHGKNYYKRLSAEALSPLSWEYGPEGDPKTEFVGVGFRHGLNTDLAESTDVIGPAFAKDVGKAVDKVFW